MDRQKVLAIVGPTGIGKTSLSVWLAKQLDGEIISCDSMQVYKKMDIGGYINLVKNLINNAEFQRKVKAEFLERELEKRLYGEEYYFMEANSDGI